MAYARACSDAFSTLAVVVLPSGKCYVAHIDTTENIHLDFKVKQIKKDAVASMIDPIFNLSFLFKFSADEHKLLIIQLSGFILGNLILH